MIVFAGWVSMLVTIIVAIESCSLEGEGGERGAKLWLVGSSINTPGTNC